MEGVLVENLNDVETNRLNRTRDHIEFLNGHKAIDLVAQVKETHGLRPQELFKLLKESKKKSFMRTTKIGSLLQINVEKLAKLLPLHLIAVVLSSQRDEVLLSYLLRGLRLLHSICEIAFRFPKIEQENCRPFAPLLNSSCL